MHEPLRRFKAEFFKALSHPIRIKILEYLAEGELSVTELQARLEIDPSSVSQQLAILRHKHIVDTRKAGTTVFYRVRDPLVHDLLAVARAIFNNQLIDTQAMLEQLDDELAVPAIHRPAAPRPSRSRTHA